MEVMFIYGDAGTGKTTMAKETALINVNGNESDIFISSGSRDILDGYEGQTAIILDDLRPSCLNLSDLLKMLDNNTASSVSSRYHNKYITECKFMFITTTLQIDDFFKSVFSEQPETEIQFKRRCVCLCRLTPEYMYISLWSDEQKRYIPCSPVKNAYSSKFAELSMEKKLKAACDLLNLPLKIMEKSKFENHKKAVEEEKKQAVQVHFKEIPNDEKLPF